MFLINVYNAVYVFVAMYKDVRNVYATKMFCPIDLTCHIYKEA